MCNSFVIHVIFIFSNLDLIVVRNVNIRHLLVIGHNIKNKNDWCRMEN